jgi:hypothetical protein
LIRMKIMSYYLDYTAMYWRKLCPICI